MLSFGTAFAGISLGTTFSGEGIGGLSMLSLLTREQTFLPIRRVPWADFSKTAHNGKVIVMIAKAKIIKPFSAVFPASLQPFNKIGSLTSITKDEFLY